MVYDLDTIILDGFIFVPFDWFEDLYFSECMRIECLILLVALNQLAI